MDAVIKIGKDVPQFDYVESAISDVKVKGSYNAQGAFKVSEVTVGSLSAKPTQRFWDSLCSRFGFAPSIYKYFSHAEVYKRVSEKLGATDAKKSKDAVRVAYEKPTGSDAPQLLAVSNPKKNIVFDHTLARVLEHSVPQMLTYRPGVVISRHKLKREIDFDIGGDMHSGQITLETPIDGYGIPALYLTLLRQVCVNGAVAYSSAFRSGIIIGKGDSPEYTLERTLAAYNNEDGFSALKDRFLVAQNSQASAWECRKLGKMLWKLGDGDFKREFVQTLPEGQRKAIRNRLCECLMQKTGDLRMLYGVAQLDSVSEKRMRTLPSKCRVYDLLNFASEVATHQINADSARTLNAFTGDLVSKEYDLEGSAQDYVDFDAFVDAATKKSVADRDAAATALANHIVDQPVKIIDHRPVLVAPVAPAN